VTARRLASLAAAALLAIASSASRAQSVGIYGAGMQAWTGCWAPEQTLTPAGVARLVCIVPTANVNVVQVAAMNGGLIARETIDATGKPFPFEVKGCSGTRRAAWSQDSRRLFIRTTGVCQGVPLAVSAIFSISASGEWVDVEGIGTRGGTSVRVARYRDVGVPAGLPLDVARSIRANALARESTRAAFGAPVHIEDVIDALRFADADVVAGWIREGAQRFDITQSDVANLDLSGFSSRLTDALAAIADSLARSADSTAYAEAAAIDQQAIEAKFDDDFVPLSYWGAGYYLPAALRGGADARGAHGRGGNMTDGRGGTVRLGTSYR
jgi:hypothetical protein